MQKRRSVPARLVREITRVPRNVRRLFSRLLRSTRPKGDVLDRYADWISRHEPGPAELEAQRQESAKWPHCPKISLLIPVFITPTRFLNELFGSIVAQTYQNWEARVIDAGPGHEEALGHWSEMDERIYVERVAENLGIAENTNRALFAAGGELIALVDHDDKLPAFALYELARAALENPGAEVFYSDEDRLSESGERTNPFFKPEWSPELMYSCMYFGHLTAYNRTFAFSLGRFRKEFDLSQDYDFALRAVERAQRIVHIPHVLYHWREHALSGASGGKPEARRTNLAALQSAMQRRGFAADIVEMPAANRVRMQMKTPPGVSIIIPTDSPARALKCARDLVPQTDYPNLEVIIVTNSNLIHQLGHTARADFPAVRFISFDEPFNFSRKCNRGAMEATGERLIFLNDDVEPEQADWVQQMIEPLENPAVGAVAPKLIYDDGSIQHAGLVTGVRGFVGTAFHRQPSATRAHFNFAQSMRNVSALSGACLGLRRDSFAQAGGFDEVNTPVSHSDVDLCFRIRARGMRCVYTPFTNLKHLGSASGDLAGARETKDAKATIYLLNRWGGYITHDPFFTENMRDWLFTDSPAPIRMFARNQLPVTTSRIDIIFVSPDLSRSGAPLLLFHLAQWCRSNGYFVTVVAAADGPLGDSFKAAEIPLIIDPLSGSDHPSLGRLLRNFDLVVANTIRSSSAVRAARNEDVPAVWWLHETRLGERFLEKDARISAALPLASLIMAPSDKSLAICRQRHNCAAVKLVSGIPDFYLTTKPCREEPNLIQFLLVGTIEYRKGQDVFIAAVARVARSLTEKAVFQIVGSGIEAEFLSRIRNEAGKIPNLKSREAVDYEECLSLIAGADVIVCASRDEAMPLTLLEAMSFGKTIVSTTAGGIPEYLSDGINSLLVPPENPAALAAAFEHVILNREEARKMGLRARELFEQQHTIGALGGNFTALIEPLSRHKQKSGMVAATA